MAESNENLCLFCGKPLPSSEGLAGWPLDCPECRTALLTVAEKTGRGEGTPGEDLPKVGVHPQTDSGPLLKTELPFTEPQVDQSANADQQLFGGMKSDVRDKVPEQLTAGRATGYLLGMVLMTVGGPIFAVGICITAFFITRGWMLGIKYEVILLALVATVAATVVGGVLMFGGYWIFNRSRDKRRRQRTF